MTDPFVPVGSDWGLWPLAGLRSAGLPAERVAGLADDADVSATLTATALDPWFREALAWQNREVGQHWLDAHAARLAAGEDRLSRRPQRNRILARYLQRYATKNDTIGFFGPIAWARLCPSEPGLTFRRLGHDLRRRAHFETKPLRELAQQWQEDPALRAHLPAWPNPSCRVSGTRLLRPRRSPRPLSADELAVLSVCAGGATASQALARLREHHPELGFDHVDEVLSLFTVMAADRLLSWGFALPVDERAEEHLAAQLADVPAEPGDRYRDLLRSLVEARDEVERAAGDPDKVGDRLDAVARQYQQVRGAAAPGRSVLWLDTVSDLEGVVGGPLIDALATPLDLLLTASRWLTWEVAAGVAREAAVRVAREPDRRIPFAALLVELAPELTGAPGLVLDRVVRRMQETAGDLLLRELSLADLTSRWRAAFDAPAPGWAAARVHSPDLMLAKDGDRFRWVLGEIHLAVNTLDNRCFVVNQRRPGEVEDLVAASTPSVRYLPAFAHSWPDISPRTYPPLAVQVPDRFVYWALEGEDVLPRSIPRLPCAGLDVVLRNDIPVVTDRAGLSVPFTEFAGELLSFLVGNAFDLFGPRPWTPRVVVDQVVVQRETWQVPVADLGPDDPRAFIRVLGDLGVPRHVFVRVPGDKKPVFCDLRSDLLVRNVVRMLNRDDPEAHVRVQEMLPGFDELVLAGPDGRHTSEFRLVAVDRRGWPA
jgi:hypothetical protein